MNTYNLSVGNAIFSIRYNLTNGDLGIDFDKTHPPALNVNTSYTDNKLTIEIPRALLDSKDSTGKDDDFVVFFVDRNREIYADKNSRILEIYTFGDSQLIGTISSYSNLKE